LPWNCKGQLYPVTTSGLKAIWRRARLRKTGPRLPDDLRFHDTRHDFATTLLRTTGNLKLVPMALGHSKIETTTKYADVLDDEVAAGMEAAKVRMKKRAKARTKTA
jgi:integrase